MKKSLVVGINYEGTGSALRGCINDAHNMQKLFLDRGFDEVKLVLEKEATTAGIKAGLEWLVSGTSPGDVIAFHFSGHGSQLPSRDESDGWEEIICPYDLNWRDKVITDKDLKTVFNKVPVGVNVTLILDCCHAGTALNQDESYQVTPNTKGAIETGDEGRYMQPPTAVMKKISAGEMVEWSAERDVNKSAMLVAAARSDQTAADAFIDGSFQGAASAALAKSVNANLSLSYRTLIEEMNQYMIENRFTQRPQLDGSFGLHNEVFLEPFTKKSDATLAADTPAVPVVVAPEEVAPVANQKDNTSGFILTLIFIAIIIAIFS